MLEPAHQQRRRPAARKRRPVVELGQLGIQGGVVHPQLQELRVGELEQEFDVLVGLLRLEHERRVPAQHGEVLLGVAEATGEQVPAGVLSEGPRLTEQQLRQRSVIERTGGHPFAARVRQADEPADRVVLGDGGNSRPYNGGPELGGQLGQRRPEDAGEIGPLQRAHQRHRRRPWRQLR